MLRLEPLPDDMDSPEWNPTSVDLQTLPVDDFAGTFADIETELFRTDPRRAWDACDDYVHGAIQALWAA